MKHSKSTPLALALMAGALITAPAFAADQGATTGSANQQTADKDFGKLSTDGVNAFADVRMARMAIFNGDTNKAKSLIDNAQTALNSAKSDDTVFMKAESDLKPAPGQEQNTAKTGTPDNANATPSTTKVAWIPVDGEMTFGEDYVASPDKAAGVAKADTQLKQGDKKAAMETLKLANIDVDFTEEVAPLKATINGVNKAAQLVDQGHYYEANQALKSVEDGIRFDNDVITGTPEKSTSHS
jgi:hypothetical protein